MEGAEGVTSCLLLGDCAVTLRARSTGEVRYDFATQADFANPGYEYHILAGTNRQLLFVKQKEGRVTQFLLQMLGQTMPVYRIKKRLRDCISFYYSGDWEDATGTFTTVGKVGRFGVNGEVWEDA